MQNALKEKVNKQSVYERSSFIQGKGEKPKLLGPAVMITELNKNKFKSPFG